MICMGKRTCASQPEVQQLFGATLGETSSPRADVQPSIGQATPVTPGQSSREQLPCFSSLRLWLLRNSGEGESRLFAGCAMVSPRTPVLEVMASYLPGYMGHSRFFSTTTKLTCKTTLRLFFSQVLRITRGHYYLHGNIFDRLGKKCLFLCGRPFLGHWLCSHLLNHKAMQNTEPNVAMLPQTKHSFSLK